MRLATNTINAEQVRRETEGGTEYLVAPVVLVQAMELNGGYLPQREIRASASDWAGVPVPIDHPTDDDQPVSIDDDRASVPVIGQVRNPEARDGGERLVGDLWINIDRAESAGSEGERVLRRLQNGDAVEVSTGYVPGKFVAGQFDGEQRDRAVLNIQPDHLAVLPDDTGKCSLADGCGAGAPRAPAVNQLYVQATDDDVTPESGVSEATGPIANKTVAGVTFEGTAGGKLDESAIPDDDFESHYLFDGDTKSDSSYPVVDSSGNLRRGNVEAAFKLGARGGVSRAELYRKLRKLNGEFESPPIDPEKLETNALQQALDAVKAALGGRESPANEPAESGADSTDTTEPTMGDRTQTLVENHDFDASNLPDEDTECFDAIYNRFVESDESDETDEQTQNQADDAVLDEIQQLREEMVTEDDVEEMLAANREREQKRDLAAEIVANSDDYEDTEAVLEDYPTVAALETKKDDVTESAVANFAGQRGARPTSSNGDASDYPSPIASERAKELEGGD